MNIAEISGVAGTFLVAFAYVPQIYHLFKEDCAYGISVRAWLVWLIAALMLLPKALVAGDPIFITLFLVQIAAITITLVFAYFHQGPACPNHKTWF